MNSTETEKGTNVFHLKLKQKNKCKKNNRKIRMFHYFLLQYLKQRSVNFQLTYSLKRNS